MESVCFSVVNGNAQDVVDLFGRNRWMHYADDRSPSKFSDGHLGASGESLTGKERFGDEDSNEAFWLGFNTLSQQ